MSTTPDAELATLRASLAAAERERDELHKASAKRCEQLNALIDANGGWSNEDGSYAGNLKRIIDTLARENEALRGALEQIATPDGGEIQVLIDGERVVMVPQGRVQWRVDQALAALVNPTAKEGKNP